MGKTLLFLGLGLSLCLTALAATAAWVRVGNFPPPVDGYHDQQIPSLFGKLTGRIQREPVNLVATIIFFVAIIHTFLTAQFRKIAHRYQRRYETIEDSLPADPGKKHDELIFRAELFYFMGEVEAVFGIWLVPLFVAIIAFHGWSTMVDYVGNVNVADAIFVVVIMAMASSLMVGKCPEFQYSSWHLLRARLARIKARAIFCADSDNEASAIIRIKRLSFSARYATLTIRHFIWNSL
jgi:hypothetical protein